MSLFLWLSSKNPILPCNLLNTTLSFLQSYKHADNVYMKNIMFLTENSKIIFKFCYLLLVVNAQFVAQNPYWFSISTLGIYAGNVKRISGGVLTTLVCC